MCFCFDGDNAVTAYRPENCRERLLDASARAERPVTSQSAPNQFRAVGSFEPADAGHVRHIAVGRIPSY
jgi:hypothetical protein